MADPLSITASVLTVAGAGIKLTTALYTLVDTIRNANVEIELMTSEITIFSCTLDEVHDHMTTSRPLYSTNLMTNLKKLLETCTRVYSEIEKILKLGKAGKSYKLTNHLIQKLNQDESDQPDGAPRRTQELQILQQRERQTRLRAEALVIANYWAVLQSQEASQVASQQGLLTQGPDSETSSSMETNLWLWQVVPYRPPDHENRTYDRQGRAFGNTETASTRSVRSSASKTVRQLVKTWTNDASKEPDQQRSSFKSQPNAQDSQVPLRRVSKPSDGWPLKSPTDKLGPQTISQSEVTAKDDVETVQTADSPELTPANDPQVLKSMLHKKTQQGSERIETKSARVQSPTLSLKSNSSDNNIKVRISQGSECTYSIADDLSISRRTSSSWEGRRDTEETTGNDSSSDQQGRLETADGLEDSDTSKEFNRHRHQVRYGRPAPFPMDQSVADPFPSPPQEPNTLAHTFPPPPPPPLYHYYPGFQPTPSMLPVPPPAPVQFEVPAMNGPDNDKKFARLEKLMMDIKEEQAAREAAEIKRKGDKRAAEAAHAREQALLEREQAVSDIEKAAKKAAKEASEVKQVIKLKDAVGRTFRFPFANCRTWEVSPPAAR
ncbi:MAG: hypothetical protein Q9174_002797 [Haloplaca sp. 1 TL-2023]